MPACKAALLLLTACAACLARSGPGERSDGEADSLVALTHVTVIDGTGRAPQPEMDVVIRDGHIAEVFPSGTRPLPAGAAVTDLRGRYLMPGMIDTHVHLGTRERPEGMMAEILHEAFMGGVTTVRDMGGTAAIVAPLAAASRPDAAATPRIYAGAIVAGPGGWFDGDRGRLMAGRFTPGQAPMVRRVDEAVDVERVVREAREAGAAGIKVYGAVPPGLILRLSAEAHRQGLRAWSHLAVDPGRPRDVLAAGVDVVSHGDMFIAEVMPALAPGATDEERRALRHRTFLSTPLDAPPLVALLEQMRRRGTILEPTLLIMLPGPDSTGQVPPRASTLFHFAAGMTREAHRRGVMIAAGTDAIGGSSPNLHAELQLLVDSAGLSPLEAITAATRNGARALGADSLGTIEPGKVADLVVLAADPTRDIANTLTVVSVMRAGRMHTRTRPVLVPPQARAPGARP
jgi:imidazolonepropionase-like amidohydrolase